MPTAEELKTRIESALPGASAAVEDLTGTGDHFRAEVVSERFEGLSRIEQHQLVYSIFGEEIGGAASPPPPKTTPPPPSPPPPTRRTPTSRPRPSPTKRGCAPRR